MNEHSERVRRQKLAIRQARDEAIRKARNGAFYAAAKGISDRARQMWLDGARDLVREARELNRNALRIR